MASPQACSVLLIDDHPAVRQGLAALLASRGFLRLIEAATAEEARRVLDATPIDLAILDLSLEQGNGLDLVPDLTGRGGRVIVYSMFEDARTIRRSQQFGALGYVTKRDDPAGLLDAVDHVIDGRSYLSPRAAAALDEAASSAGGKELSERER